MVRLLLVIALAVALPGAAFATAPSMNTTPQLKLIKHVPLVFPAHHLKGWFSLKPFCVGLMFTVTPEGVPTDIRAAKVYPDLVKLRESGFLRAARKTLSQWRFAPPKTSAGNPTTVRDVLRTFVYRVLPGPPPRKPKAVNGLITSLCAGDMFPALPIRISGYVQNGGTAGILMVTSNISDSRNDSKPVRYTLMLTPELTAKVSRLGESVIKVRYCIDPKGRLSNVQMIGGNDAARQAALPILNILDLPTWNARVWLCGLHTRVKFFGTPKAKTLGTIGRSWFNNFVVHSDAPKFLSSTPPELHVTIPTGAQLPPKAIIELKLCVSANGRPYDIQVTKATPPKIFNQAAVKTASGWHFSPNRYDTCDIYQRVAFKIPHAK